MRSRLKIPLRTYLHVDFERSNLSVRMGMRRLARTRVGADEFPYRLTHASEQEMENRPAMIMLWFAFCNFCLIQESRLRVT